MLSLIFHSVLSTASPLEGVWASLARASRAVLGGACPDAKGEPCPPAASPRRDLAAITGDLYLAGLARRRAEGEACAAGALGKSLGDLDQLGQSVTESLSQLRSIETSREIALADGDQASADALGVVRDTVLAGVPYAAHPSVAAFLRRALQKSAAVKNDDVGELRAALALAQIQTRKNQIRLGEMADGKRPFDPSVKESLAQDRELIAGYIAGHPEARAAACAVDASYGQGAALRDRVLPAVGLGLTAAVLPQARLAARAAAGEALSGLRALALARGVVAAPATTRLLSAAATLVDVTAGAQAIDRECGHSYVGAEARPNAACEQTDVATVQAKRCAESALLTLIGTGVAVSPLVKEVIQSLRNARPLALAAKAKAFRSAKEIPGGAWGADDAGLSGGRYLRTADIDPAELPYDAAIRSPRAGGGLDAGKTRRTDIVLSSDENSGTVGVVRLGSLNGRPVAVKMYAKVGDADLANEVESAKLASDLGIAPRFHGTYRDADQRLNIVTDVVPGDFKNMPITTQTFDDLRTMETRLRGAHVTKANDFQAYRTREGRLLMIDAHLVKDGPDQLARSLWFQRVRLLRDAPADVAAREIDLLRRTQPDFLRDLTNLVPGWVEKGVNISQPLRDLAPRGIRSF